MPLGPGAVDLSTQGTVRVATSVATIVSQLNASVAGDTVQIAAGSYGAVTTNRSIGSGLIRIVPAAGATVTIASVNLTGAQGLDWRGINTTGEVYYSSTVRCRWRGGVSTPGATLTGHNIRESCSDLVIEDATITDPDCSFFLYADRDTLASNNITIQRCRSNNVAQDHVFIGRGTNVVIQDNEFFGNTEDPEHSDGVQIVGGKTVTIRRNHIACTRAFRDAAIDRNDHGIICNYDPNEVGAGGTAGRVPENIVIENNLIHEQTSHGITLAGVLGCTIRNNTIYDNGLSGTELALSVAPDSGNTISGLVLVNNIFNKIAISGVTPTTNTHNFVADGSGPVGTSRLTGAPGFVDNSTAAALDYSPAVGSQNLGSGTTSGAPSTDLLGTARPSPPSRGALEQTATGGGGGGGGTPTPPVIRATTAAGSVDSASSTVTKPAGTVSGDLLLALQFATADGAAASMTAPAGFVQQGVTHTVTDGSFGMHGKVWTKTAGGSEPANYTFAASSSSDGNAVILIAVQTGTFDPAAPFDVAPTWGGLASATTAQAAPQIDPTTTSTRMVSAWASATFNNLCTYTVPASMVELADYQPAANYIAVAAGSELLAADSATGTRTATSTRGSYHATVSLAIAPAPSTALTGAVAGLLPGPSSAIAATVRATGAVAGSTPAPTAAATAAVRASGSVTGALPTPAMTAQGTVAASGSVAGVAPSPTATMAATHTAPGALDATTPAPVGALTSTMSAPGAVAATLPGPTATITTTMSTPAAVDGSLPSPAAAVTATVTATGAVNAAAPTPEASATGTVTAAGSVAATLPAAASALTGTVTADGAVAAELPSPAGGITGTVGTPAALNATLPAPGGDVTATVTASGGVDATAPIPTAALLGSVDSGGGLLSAALPTPAAALTADLTVPGVVDGALPTPQATIGADTEAVTATLDATLPTPGAALAGTSTIPGGVAGTLPPATGSLAGLVTLTVAVAGVLPTPSAALAEDVASTGWPPAVSGPFTAPLTDAAVGSGEPLITAQVAGSEPLAVATRT